MTRATVIAAIKSLLIGIAKTILEWLLVVAAIWAGCAGVVCVIWMLLAVTCNIADQEDAKAARELHLDQGK